MFYKHYVEVICYLITTINQKIYFKIIISKEAFEDKVIHFIVVNKTVLITITGPMPGQLLLQRIWSNMWLLISFGYNEEEMNIKTNIISNLYVYFIRIGRLSGNTFNTKLYKLLSLFRL